MTSGRKLDANMKLYVKGEKCLQNILLSCSSAQSQKINLDVVDDDDCYLIDSLRPQTVAGGTRFKPVPVLS